jgi:hypothetical protein
MPITRTIMIDDDGSGTTGTILNNAWKQELYNQIDAFAAAAPQVGTWVPVDASGAGLAITVVTARYWKLDKLVVLSGYFVYPSNSDANVAKVGGIPFPNGAADGGLYLTNLTAHGFFLVSGATAMEIRNGATGVPRTNVEMAGANLVIAGTYLTA